MPSRCHPRCPQQILLPRGQVWPGLCFCTLPHPGGKGHPQSQAAGFAHECHVARWFADC